MASTYRRAVGVFSSRTQTASALQALSDSGFSMGDVSIIAKDADRQGDIAGVSVKNEVTNQADAGGAIGAATGGVLGGVTGLLVGLGTLTIPGLGPALLAGEAAVVLSTLIGGAAGAAAGGLVGALVGMGIPQHRAKRYQDRVAQGGYLVMVKGTEVEVARAERSLGSAGIEDWGVYPMADQPGQVEPNGYRPGTDRDRPLSTSSQNNNRFDEQRDPNWRDRPVDRPYVGSNLSEEAPYRPADRTPDLAQREVSEITPRTHRDQTWRNAQGMTLHDRGDRNHNPSQPDYRSTGLPHSSNPLQATSATVTDLPRSEKRRVVGVFLNRERMEEALAQLQKTGFPMHTLSMAVREAEASPSGSRQDYGSHSLAGATRLTAGLDRVLLPEVGTVLVMGPDADALAGTFLHTQSGSAGNGAMGTAHSLGIAPESTHLYRRHLTSGAYLITLRGSNQGLLQAASTLGEWGMHDWGIYDVGHR